MARFDPRQHCILYGYRGSIAHNLYVPPDEPMSTDDVDLMGVCIAPLSCYIGLDHFEQQEIKSGPNDIVIYGLRKFVHLLTKGNPNVIGFLWNDETMFETISPLGRQLITNRDLFSSKAVYNSFVGYATSQLKKMSGGAFQGYMGNKRKDIVRQYGYDTKNAAHLIRLLRMAVEFFQTGRMKMYRDKDRDELLSIKRGGWTLARVEREAEQLFVSARAAKDKSGLPEQPDRQMVNDLLVGIMQEHFGIPL